jgi:ectoine hydroxylase-related dioxygenase (phytanoyl-CoA dioxygenase family)
MNFLETWQQQGYLVLRGVLDTERIATLRQNSEQAYDQWRHNSSSENQPLNYYYRDEAWSMLHLNHPQYYRQHPERLAFLLDVIADPSILEVLGAIFREDFVMHQANLYINPPGKSWNGAWHRDSQFYPGAVGEAEREHVMQEADPPRELHMHIPLVPTAASDVVPGSHHRWDTPEEYRVRREAPQSDEMPGAVNLKLEPGDLGFFHVNSIHRGLYQSEIPRRTIAVTYGRASFPRAATGPRMKEWLGYIATYQPWFLEPHYLDGVKPQTRAFFERFIEIYRDSWKPEYLDELNPERQEYFKSGNLHSAAAV